MESIVQNLCTQLREDFERHGRSWRNLSFWTVAVYHYGAWAQGLPPGRWKRLGSRAYGAMFLAVEAVTGCTINREARIGSEFRLVHAGNVRIHPEAVLGDRCTVLHDVTIGSNMDKRGLPIIGDDVHIGTGARILGPIHVGNGARIAANSLVISDVPAGATAVGVPARVMTYTGRTAEVVAARVRPAPPAAASVGS